MLLVDGNGVVPCTTPRIKIPTMHFAEATEQVAFGRCLVPSTATKTLLLQVLLTPLPQFHSYLTYAWVGT